MFCQEPVLNIILSEVESILGLSFSGGGGERKWDFTLNLNKGIGTRMQGYVNGE